MYAPLISVSLSGAVVLVLVLLFSIERARGARFIFLWRERFDFFLFKVRHRLFVFFRMLRRDAVRQVARYMYHTVLAKVLDMLGRVEVRIKQKMRENRTHARSLESDRIELNKLEEIALHKLSVALSEDEKRQRKEQSINGQH